MLLAGFLRLLLLVHTADPPELVASSSSLVALLADHTADGTAVPCPRLALFASYDRPHAVRQVGDVLIATLRAQLVQCLVKVQEVVTVQSARPFGLVDVFG